MVSKIDAIQGAGRKWPIAAEAASWVVYQDRRYSGARKLRKQIVECAALSACGYKVPCPVIDDGCAGPMQDDLDDLFNAAQKAAEKALAADDGRKS